MTGRPGLPEYHPQGLACGVVVARVNQSLIVRLANAHDLASRQFGPRSAVLYRGLPGRDSLPQTFDRLVVGTSIG